MTYIHTCGPRPSRLYRVYISSSRAINNIHSSATCTEKNGWIISWNKVFWDRAAKKLIKLNYPVRVGKTFDRVLKRHGFFPAATLPTTVCYWSIPFLPCNLAFFPSLYRVWTSGGMEEELDPCCLRSFLWPLMEGEWWGYCPWWTSATRPTITSIYCTWVYYPKPGTPSPGRRAWCGYKGKWGISPIATT